MLSIRDSCLFGRIAFDYFCHDIFDWIVIGHKAPVLSSLSKKGDARWSIAGERVDGARL